MKQLLVPTDFSGHSNKAYTFALEIASRANAEITLLHVIEPPYNFASEVEDMMEVIEKNAESRLKNLKSSKSDTDFSKVRVKTVIRNGMTIPKILEQIRKTKTDLVVMGSKGEKGLKKVLFGSVATDVMQRSPVPVLVIPDMDSFPDLNNILFTTDYRAKDPVNLKKTFEFAKLFDSKISVLHIAKEPDFETDIRHRGFINYVTEINGYDKLHFTLKVNKDTLGGISDYVAENKISLIVLNRYPKSVLKSLLENNHARKMMDYSRLPMLVLSGE